jgi:hypothetical protein
MKQYGSYQVRWVSGIAHAARFYAVMALHTQALQRSARTSLGESLSLKETTAKGALMGTVALALFYWISANLVIAAVWTLYCLWPRRRGNAKSIHNQVRRAL